MRRGFGKILLMLAALLGASVSWTQMSPADMKALAGMKMVEPEAERPGDRALSCVQIAREMGEILKKRGLKKVVNSAPAKNCQRPTMDAAAMGEMMGVVNDPRVMRLSLLAMEKRCDAELGPKDEPVPARDVCGNKGVAPASAPISGPTDPFAKQGAPPAKPAASDPFARH